MVSVMMALSAVVVVSAVLWRGPRELIVEAKDLVGLHLVEGHAEIIRNAAAESGLDPLVVAGVMYAESRGRGGQTSSSGAHGLMQLVPAAAHDAARRLGVSEPGVDQLKDDDELNVRLGAAHLAWLLEHRGDWNLEQVLVSYNAGRTRLVGWIEKYGSYDRWRLQELAREERGEAPSGALRYAQEVLRAMERLRERGAFTREL